MNGQSKLTPRTRGGQVAPEGVSPLVSSADLGPEAGDARVAPADTAPTTAADEKDVVKRVERMVRYAGHEAFKDNVRLFGKMMVPVVLVSVWLFGIFAALSYAVPHWICEKEVMELSVSVFSSIYGCVCSQNGLFRAGLLSRPRLMCPRLQGRLLHRHRRKSLLACFLDHSVRMDDSVPWICGQSDVWWVQQS